ncbi:MAG: SCO family protein [Betaproteobacteria bacterium]|nr:SCO family protein [Betaproteobacteria bacterium]
MDHSFNIATLRQVFTPEAVVHAMLGLRTKQGRTLEPMDPWRRALLRACVACCMLPMVSCGNDGPRFQNTDISGANYGSDFALLDPDGNTRRLADFRGKVVMLFFGFIQCPDVCPTSLQRAAAVRRLLGANGELLQIIFVTLDPERDSPEILREYSAAFDANVLGLYGTPEQTRETADNFRIYFRKVPVGGGYTIDHTATSYIYDPEGRLRLTVNYQSPAKAIAADVALLLHSSSTINDKEAQ